MLISVFISLPKSEEGAGFSLVVPKPLSLLLSLIKLLDVACGQGHLCRPSSACPIRGITLPSCLLASLLVLLVNLMICRQDCQARALGLGL